MGYKKYKSEKLFDGYHVQFGKVLITKEDGTIEGIVNESEAGDDIQHLEGILSPGFINCHCHLELSHLKNVIPPHTGLIEFLCSVITKREPVNNGTNDNSTNRKMKEIAEAEKEMYGNGIVAVADIGNTADTAAVKSKSNIRWQNFVEVLSFTDEKAEENIKYYQQVAGELENILKISNSTYRTSIVPHAPYSISPKTFRQINALTKNQIISMHNQEHPAENVLYQTGAGEYLKLFKLFGMEKSPFPVTRQNSIQSVLPNFNNGQTLFLVHNTCMTDEDITWANHFAEIAGIKLMYCLCINANLYIENKVPPVELFIKNNCHVVLGTDSYSSNWQLSIAKEIASFQKYFPTIPEETFLKWATSNGAKALQWDDTLGSFEYGKKPGVILINKNYSSSLRLV